MQVRTANATFDRVLNIFRGDPFTTGDLAGSGSNLVSRIAVTNGEQLVIAVGSRPQITGLPAPTGSVDLQLAFTATDAPPANDNQAQATVLDLSQTLSQSGDLTLATQEDGETNVREGTGSVWYSATAPGDGYVQLNAQGAGFAAQIAAYRGTTLTNLTLIGAANSDTATPVVVQVSAGETIWLQVSSAEGWPGQFLLTSRLLPARQNDDFANRIVVTGPNPTLSMWLYPGGLESGEPSHAAGVTQSAWWTWEAPVTGMAVFREGSLNNAITNLEVYTGSRLDRLTPVPVNRSVGTWLASFNVQAGVTYQFAVLGGPDFRDLVSFPFSVVPTVPGTNDRPENAVELHGTEIGHSSNYTATRDPDEPAVNPGSSRIIWWHWRAPVTDQVAAAFPAGSVLHPILAIYKGDSLAAMTLVASGEGYLRWGATAGQGYWIAVETTAEDVGEICPQMYQVVRGIYPARTVPGNLVQNGSFENDDEPFAFWGIEHPTNYSVNEPGGTDGGNYIDLSDAHLLWQDITTEPGATYRIDFATYEIADTNRIAVHFGEVEAGIAVYTPGPVTYLPYWGWDTFYATATTNVTRLLFEQLDGSGLIDGISVTRFSAAPLVQGTLQDQVAFAGLDASFTVSVIGSGPLHYQWSFAGQPLTNAPDAPTLILPAVTQAQSSLYEVIISNALGSVSGGQAQLRVEDSAAPSIVSQPEGGLLAPGQFYVLRVSAVGAPPLAYQWFHGDAAVPDATNRTLIFNAVTTNDFGGYTVTISSPGGSSRSLPATLGEADVPDGGGIVFMQNKGGSGAQSVLAPVYDSDGTTPLSGSDFVAQLYAGPTPTELRPVGEPVEFLKSAHSAGYFEGGSLVIPGVAPGAMGQFQVRVWESRAGPSYESARAAGGKFGRSAIFSLETTIPPNLPPPLTGLQSFALQAGVPSFFIGRIDPVGIDPDGRLRWHLTGQASLRYVIEASHDGSNWAPLTVLASETGSAEFTDAPDASHVVFYRARLLD